MHELATFARHMKRGACSWPTAGPAQGARWPQIFLALNPTDAGKEAFPNLPCPHCSPGPNYTNPFEMEMRVAFDTRSVAVKSAQHLRKPRLTPCMCSHFPVQLTLAVYHRTSDNGLRAIYRHMLRVRHPIRTTQVLLESRGWCALYGQRRQGSFVVMFSPTDFQNNAN